MDRFVLYKSPSFLQRKGEVFLQTGEGRLIMTTPMDNEEVTKRFLETVTNSAPTQGDVNSFLRNSKPNAEEVGFGLHASLPGEDLVWQTIGKEVSTTVIVNDTKLSEKEIRKPVLWSKSNTDPEIRAWTSEGPPNAKEMWDAFREGALVEGDDAGQRLQPGWNTLRGAVMKGLDKVVLSWSENGTIKKVKKPVKPLVDYLAKVWNVKFLSLNESIEAYKTRARALWGAYANSRTTEDEKARARNEMESKLMEFHSTALYKLNKGKWIVEKLFGAMGMLVGKSLEANGKRTLVLLLVQQVVRPDTTLKWILKHIVEWYSASRGATGHDVFPSQVGPATAPLGDAAASASWGMISFVCTYFLEILVALQVIVVSGQLYAKWQLGGGSDDEPRLSVATVVYRLYRVIVSVLEHFHLRASSMESFATPTPQTDSALRTFEMLRKWWFGNPSVDESNAEETLLRLRVEALDAEIDAQIRAEPDRFKGMVPARVHLMEEKRDALKRELAATALSAGPDAGPEAGPEAKSSCTVS